MSDDNATPAPLTRRGMTRTLFLGVTGAGLLTVAAACGLDDDDDDDYKRKKRKKRKKSR